VILLAKKKRIKANNKVKKGKINIKYEFKLLTLVALLILIYLSLFIEMGYFGDLMKSFLLGLFSYSAFIVPLIVVSYTFVSINKNIAPRYKYRKYAFFGIIISFMLFNGLIINSYFINILNNISKTFLVDSYHNGIIFKGLGVIGDIIYIFFYKFFGKIGVGVVSLFIFSISVIALTNYEFNFSKLRNLFIKKERKIISSEKPKRETIKENVINEFELLEFKRKNSREEPKKEVKVFSFSDFNKNNELNRENIKEEIKNTKDQPLTEEVKVKMETEMGKKSHTKLESSFILPKVDILNKPKSSNDNSKQDAMSKAILLEQVLNNFGIKSKINDIVQGPTVTRFEIQLEPGIKLSRIQNLQDDIALNMAVSHVRVAPVHGKVAVGIEIPNIKNSMVSLREVIEDRGFKLSKSNLNFALGKDISGETIIADLASMPHLLIAGSTGSGKSVCVNTIIASILFNSTPDEVKFLMIDPKVVELNIYNGIPHLILPVVTDPKKASIALGWAVNEMSKRYELFADSGVKDIESFNKKFNDNKLPKIVVIIDELADLMMVAPSQVEDSIARLAQMARAAGIHLIVATQRPSVDVITGLIKANIPSRIAFAVSSQIDSRTILDMGGAEKLLGKGDMLFNPVGLNKPKRVQGAFVSEEEILKLVNHLKSQIDSVDYNEDIIKETAINVDSDSDEMFNDAVRFIVTSKNASASMLQRRFKIGYNRAARMIDEMEEKGIVGPLKGSKGREILMDESELMNNE
jgi:S-DNA-T family DNA segregation ATPase FtsK/SpoIIIE